MGYCTSCGHELGVGRFCTNCGHPVAPGTAADPPAARYPLFADEVESDPETEPDPVWAEPTTHRAAAPTRPWGPWLAIAAALAVVLVLVLVALRLVSAGDGPSPAATDPTREPAATATAGGGQGQGGGRPSGDVARESSVEVPEEAPPNEDVAGNPTTYVGANMLDGIPETCWRMAGDGTGSELVVTLPREAHLTTVGMINGYAKVAEDAQGREVDWYSGNRRVLAVEWEFDDGTTVTQELGDTTDMQTVDVDVRTATVVLRLVSVSEPGNGPSARDYTAISDLTLVAGR